MSPSPRCPRCALAAAPRRSCGGSARPHAGRCRLGAALPTRGWRHRVGAYVAQCCFGRPILIRLPCPVGCAILNILNPIPKSSSLQQHLVRFQHFAFAKSLRSFDALHRSKLVSPKAGRPAVPLRPPGRCLEMSPNRRHRSSPQRPRGAAAAAPRRSRGAFGLPNTGQSGLGAPPRQVGHQVRLNARS